MKNRIKELRQARGLSMEKLAEAIGAGTSTINRLEKGETDLVSEWLPAIATALGVTESDILGWGKPDGMAEDAAPFKSDATHPLAGATFGPNRDLWTVRTRCLDALGIVPGDVIIIDISQAAVDGVKMGDAVVVQLLDNSDPLDNRQALTLLRQFIEPDLFITNSHNANEKPLNRRVQDVRIKGVIVNRFATVNPAAR